MKKQQDAEPAAESSEECRNFESALKQIVSVPKAEMDARVKADKEERRKRRGAK
jgi:hypothetical protein